MTKRSPSEWSDDAHYAMLEIVEALAGFVAERGFMTREDRKTAESIAKRARTLRNKMLETDDERRRSG